MSVTLTSSNSRQLDVVGELSFETDGCTMHLLGSGKNIIVDIKSENVYFRISQLIKYFRLHRAAFFALCSLANEAKISLSFILDDTVVMRIGDGARGVLPNRFTGGRALEIKTLALLRTLVKQRIRVLRST